MLVALDNHTPILNGACNEINPLSFIAGDFLSPHTGWVIEQLAKRIRDRIGELEISQTDIAGSTGISVQRLNNYINARRMPDLPTLVKLASALQTSTDYLLGAEDTVTRVGRSVMSELLLADGIAPERVVALLDTATEAMRILSALPDEGDDDIRTRLAARAAWQARGGPKPN